VKPFFDRLRNHRLENSRLQTQAGESMRIAADANRRLAAILRLSRIFVEANDEKEVVSLVLQLSVELVGALGASFVPIDERGQPLTAISYGELPAKMMDAWIEYLASPAVRHRCEICQKQGELTTACPMIQAPLTESQASAEVAGIYCLPLRRGDREFGVLNLYLPVADHLDPQAQEFLGAMLAVTSLALESIRLQQREAAALRQLGSVRQRTDLSKVLAGFLANVRDTLKTDFALILVQDIRADLQPILLTNGDFPPTLKSSLKELLEEVQTSRRPLALGDVPQDMAVIQNIQALLVAPLLLQDGSYLGALLAGNVHAQGLNQRHLNLLQTLADQVTLVVQNYHLMSEVEFNTMMAERNRLAREIHDGLAQTIGFLKLQTAQMSNYLARDERDRLQESLRVSYKVLSDTYLDARQAIDGLRIAPDGGVSGWLEQTVLEFRENSGLQVILQQAPVPADLVPEVQAQLIRIVQEALSNVRKHACAKRVWVSCDTIEGDFILEVRDDGRGFAPQDVSMSSRYGLQGMQERSQLIGAELQVTSQPGEGTTVCLRLPMRSGESIG
jgi:two-component system nitrate/nitrite sensor histidine kinase NarX